MAASGRHPTVSTDIGRVSKVRKARTRSRRSSSNVAAASPSAARRLRSDMMPAPERISGRVMLVVRSDAHGCASTQVKIASCGAGRIDSETTFASSTKISRTSVVRGLARVVESPDHGRRRWARSADGWLRPG
jgi:hypothetical protein